MKTFKKTIWSIVSCHLVVAGSCLPVATCVAQDKIAPVETIVPDSTVTLENMRVPVKNTFKSNVIIDNQTVMVPLKKTFEFNIMHRFGTVNNGYSDFYGLFAPANIRLGFNYTPIDNLQVGFGITKERMQWDGNVKYALLKQTVSESCPVSVTYYGDMAVSSLPKKGNFVSDDDRYSYFNQLIIARKVTKKFSVQVAPSLSYFNNVDGYLASDGTIKPKMNNVHCAIATLGSYMFTDALGIIANYDQPLTQHKSENPQPNISFGLQIVTITHSFQIFVGNFQSILPQSNNFNNQNDYTQSRYLIGFNISKRWISY